MLLKEIKEDDYKKIGRLFMSAQGKEVLEILNRTFYYTVSFTPGEPDVSAFKGGHRDMVQIFRNAVEKQEKSNEED